MSVICAQKKKRKLIKKKPLQLTLALKVHNFISLNVSSCPHAQTDVQR